nr:MAG TPA_asm: hypothetical protein [Caudoviricetes sp.]
MNGDIIWNNVENVKKDFKSKYLTKFKKKYCI